MDLGGLQYHYLDEGRGDPVIMVHGNPTWSFYYRELVKVLSPQYRTIVPDHIGCGLSDKPGDGAYRFTLKQRIDDLEALVDYLGLKKDLTLIVHDWGGAIGTGLAVRRPESVARMVILNTAAFHRPEGKPIPWQLWLVRNVNVLAAPLVLGLNAFARGATWMAAKKRLAGDVKKGLTAPYNSWRNRLATLRFVQDIPLQPGDPSYDEIQSIQDGLPRLNKIPKLVCWGMRDFVFDPDYLAEWKRRFPEAEFHEFHKAGHYVLEDEPEAVAQLVLDFISRHPLQDEMQRNKRP